MSSEQDPKPAPSPEWGHFEQESREQGGGYVLMHNGSEIDMKKYARKSGFAAPL